MARNGKNKQENEDPRRFGIRKLSMFLFGLVLLAVVGGSIFMSAHFNDANYFEYGCGSVFTAMILVLFFGWPIDD